MKKFLVILLSLLLALSFSLFIGCKKVEKPAEAPAPKEGIVVKNLTLFDDLWYRKNNGDCIMWRRDHIIAIKPEDTIEIFSDLVCKTPYCAGPPTYADYKSLDTDGDCRVRILPDCNISDM